MIDDAAAAVNDNDDDDSPTFEVVVDPSATNLSTFLAQRINCHYRKNCRIVVYALKVDNAAGKARQVVKFCALVGIRDGDREESVHWNPLAPTTVQVVTFYIDSRTGAQPCVAEFNVFDTDVATGDLYTHDLLGFDCYRSLLAVLWRRVLPTTTGGGGGTTTGCRVPPADNHRGRFSPTADKVTYRLVSEATRTRADPPNVSLAREIRILSAPITQVKGAGADNDDRARLYRQRVADFVVSHDRMLPVRELRGRYTTEYHQMLPANDRTDRVAFVYRLDDPRKVDILTGSFRPAIGMLAPETVDVATCDVGSIAEPRFTRPEYETLGVRAGLPTIVRGFGDTLFRTPETVTSSEAAAAAAAAAGVWQSGDETCTTLMDEYCCLSTLVPTAITVYAHRQSGTAQLAVRTLSGARRGGTKVIFASMIKPAGSGVLLTSAGSLTFFTVVNNDDDNDSTASIATASDGSDQVDDDDDDDDDTGGVIDDDDDDEEEGVSSSSDPDITYTLAELDKASESDHESDTTDSMDDSDDDDDGSSIFSVADTDTTVNDTTTEAEPSETDVTSTEEEEEEEEAADTDGNESTTTTLEDDDGCSTIDEEEEEEEEEESDGEAAAAPPAKRPRLVLPRNRHLTVSLCRNRLL